MSLLTSLLFLLLTAGTAATEAAVFSTDRGLLRRLETQGHPRARLLLHLLSSPERLGVCLLITLNVCVIFFTYTATLFFMHLSRVYPHWKQGILVGGASLTILLALLLGEVIPKAWAVHHTPAFSLRVAPLLNLLQRVLAQPVSFILWFLQKPRLAMGKAAETAVFESRLRTLVDLAQRSGALEEEERKMIEGVFEFGDRIVKDVMIPRIDTVALDVDTLLKEAIQTIVTTGHSRIPVYQESIDRILGILYAKDLLSRNFSPHEVATLPIFDLVKPVLFIPETMPVSEAFAKLRRQRIHLAVVVDEYGGTAGIVTIEDLLEEIVGEIQDEFDRAEAPPIEFLTPNKSQAIALGRLTIDELNQEMNLDLPVDKDYDTLAGFLFHEMGRIPQKGESFHYSLVEFQILEVRGNQIQKVKILRSPASKTPEPSPHIL